MRRLRVRVNGEWYVIEVGDIHQSPVEVLIDDETYLVELEGGTSESFRSNPPRVSSRQDRDQGSLGLRGIMQSNEKLVRCPLPGKVLSVSVIKGQLLDLGDEICILESMKMEQTVRAGHKGIVKSIKIKKDQTVNAGMPLIELQ
jgi:biotin carboxyl carrier protein